MCRDAAGSCPTPAGAQVPVPGFKSNNTVLPPLYKPKAPVPDGIYVIPGLDAGSDLAFGALHELSFFKRTKCSELCLREGERDRMSGPSLQ